MKLLSWNVNGIRALNKNIDFYQTIIQQDYDIIALQEIKASLLQVQEENINFGNYHLFWNPSIIKKGYSGTAILSKVQPLKVIYGLGHQAIDEEGRILTLEYPNLYFVVAYTPNSQEELKRLDFRLMFEEEFRNYLIKLNHHKPVIICGDLNVAHQEIDLKNPKANIHNPGFSAPERSAFSQLLAAGFCDTYRSLHPNTIKYSWWSYRFNSRAKNIGWRIDYFLVSNALQPLLREAQIYDEIIGSDHCPVFLNLDLS
ncbi:MAG: exodeoxyribonuclease III [Acholeplasmatales bacterium]|jgi:exodeoxyribonuclease-3|nr:exodeoxyribonuclease III [Acholeplasmatales bacterium]